jgi:hypothetical protein
MVHLPVPFMPVLSRMLSTRKAEGGASGASSFVDRIIEVISMRKLSSSDLFHSPKSYMTT